MNEQKRPNDKELKLCEYLDGQLGRAQRRELEQQLEGDDKLREQLRQYAALDGLLGGLSDRDVEGFNFDQQRAEIVAAAERKALLGQRSRQRIFLLRPLPAGLAVAASVLLVVGLSVWFFGRSGKLTGPVNAVPAVSVRIMPAAMQAGTRPGVAYMRLSPPSNQSTVPAASAKTSLPHGTVVVSTGAHAHAKAEAPENMLIY